MSDDMSDDTAEELLKIIAKYSVAPAVVIDSQLQGDLGIDSFDMVNIAIEAQEKFGFAFPRRSIPYFSTVNDAIEYIRMLRYERM